MVKRLSQYYLILIFILLLVMIILSGNQKDFIAVDNMNTVKSLEAVHIVNKYNSILEMKKEAIIPMFDNFYEAMKVANNSPVSFMGKLTAYGPDCVGCGGGSACPPRQNLKNGNIYFEDQTYGKIRIVAADRLLPCGSIVRITGINIYSEPILAVVLDRGSLIKGNHLDLLFTSESNLEGFSTSNNIKFEVIRYGW